jgi:hypothetical protein
MTYPVFNEKRHDGGFLISEANGHRSRERAVIASSADLEAGTVLGLTTATGIYAPVNPAATDGTQTAAAILFGHIYADSIYSNGTDATGTIIARDAEVNASELVYVDTMTAAQTTAALASLKSAGIVAR